MKSLWLDVRVGFRQLRRAPGFACLVLVVLALGIGGTTVMVGVLDGLLLQGPQGVRQPENLVRIYIVRDEGLIQTPDGGAGSWVDFGALRDGGSGAEDVAAFFRPQEVDYGLGKHAKRVQGRSVSRSFFSVLGVDPAVGRLFDQADESSESDRDVVVVSEAFWRRDLGADPEAIGRPLLLGGRSMTLVGVASAAFSGLDGSSVDLWIPVDRDTWSDRPDVALFSYVARLARGTNREQFRASAEVSVTARSSEFSGLDPTPHVLLGPLNIHRGPHPSGPVRLAAGLWLATIILLLIACANVTNLFLARATVRRRELAVRRALGAGRGRILRQLLIESTVLTLISGGIGLLLALLAGRLMQAVLGLKAHSFLDLPVVGFTLSASLVAGALFGVVSALQKGLLGSVLARPHASFGSRRFRGSRSALLIAAQVTLAVVLLFGAGVVFRALQAVVTIDPGLDMERLAVASMDLKSAGYDSREASELLQRGRQTLEVLPGVESASLVMPMPLTGAGWGVSVADRPGGEIVRVPEGPYAYTVGTDFFRTAGIQILAGRPLLDEDRRGSERVAVVSESLARALGGSDEPVLGRCVPIGVEERHTGACTRIVGIVADVRRNYLVASAIPYIYRSASQFPFEEGPSSFTPQFLVRLNGDPSSHLDAIRSTLEGLAPDLPYIKVQTMDDLVGSKAIRPFRTASRFLALFGSFALLLAAIGLYSSLSYLIANRTRDIGVRMALGAQRSNVVRAVIGRALVPVLVGLVSGLSLAWTLARLAAVESHGLKPQDPVVLVCVVAVLLLAALIASWLPARRASRMDPVSALRVD